MAFPINPAHRLLLEDNVSYLLLEDNASKIILDEQIALDDPLNAGTVSTVTPALTFSGEAAPAVIDSYSETNQDISEPMFAGSRNGIGQSFTGNGSTATTAIFYVQNEGLPTGNATASIWAHSGTFGTSSVPTGAALAVSDPIDVSTWTTSFQLITFSFSGINRIALTSGTHYVVSIDYSGGNVSNRIRPGTDTSAPTHAGNASILSGGTWAASSGEDACFYIYGIPNLTYEVEVDTVNTFDGGVPGGTATYYFNASDSGPTDAGAAWTNDANAFDGSTATFASGQTEGGGNLIGSGTNAPTSGGTITQVRARLYAYESGDGSGTASYSNYTTLSTPTGGWTWQKVNDLEADLVHLNSIGGIGPSTSQAIIKSGVQTLGTPSRDGTSTVASQFSFIARVEVEVTYSASPPLLDKTSDLNIGFVDDTTTSLGDDRLLLEDNVSYLLLEDNSSKLAINYDYPSSDYITYTVPAATLSNGVTYYWRARQKVQNGGSYTSWSEIRSFTVSSGTSINVSDSPTITESVTVLIPNLFVSVSDTATITETVTKELNSFISVSDIATTTESPTLLETSFISVSDSPTITESTARLLTSFINVSDTPTITEAASVYVPFYLISATESTTITESILLQDQEGVAVLDTPSVTESVQLLITSSVNVSDSPTITESQTLLGTSFINKSDTATITESPKAEINSFVSVSDIGTITESTTQLLTSFISVSDTPTTTESVTFLETSFISVSDSPTITESRTLLVTSFINVSDSSTITETPTVTIAVSNDLSISVSDTATITESLVLLETSFINAADSSSITETLSLLETSFISVSDLAAIIETKTLLLQSFISVSDNITITESQTVYVPFYLITVTDSPAITETTTLLETSFINVSETVSITETTTEQLQSFVSVSDLSTITESQSFLLTSFINAIDSPTITESTARLLTSFINVTDSIVITETPTVFVPGGNLAINVSESITVRESKNVYIEGTILRTGPSVILLTDGRLAVKLSNNMYMPL